MLQGKGENRGDVFGKTRKIMVLFCFPLFPFNSGRGENFNAEGKKGKNRGVFSERGGK